jgi:Tol biopolymer transport system component
MRKRITHSITIIIIFSIILITLPNCSSNGNNNISTKTPDESNNEDLITQEPADNSALNGSASPQDTNGRKIVYTCKEENSFYAQICIMNSDGSGIQQITNESRGGLGSPVLSPDGSKIVFHAQHEGPIKLFVMNSDGSDIQQLTTGDSQDINPAWSPDGSMIAFESFLDGVGEIFLFHVNEGTIVQLTDTPKLARHPTWSPDGSKLAYEYRNDIFVINSDGSDDHLIHEPKVIGINLSWSPDGSTILYDDGVQIFAINSDGSNLRVLADRNWSSAGHASWSPDGSMIVFYSNSANFNFGQIYIMNADGTGKQQLTFYEVSNTDPSWSP